MSWQTVALAQVAATPWRNGGGVTRELLAWPSPDDWRVRISIADVERDGPFSRFDGSERWFAVLEGAGVELSVGAAKHALTTGHAPLRFDGAAEVTCRLRDGPTRDFNLMAPPGRAQLKRVQGGGRFLVAAGSLVAVYAHRRGARLRTKAGPDSVPAATLAWQVLTRSQQVEVQTEDALWLEVSQ
jgi:environmental stress-induced protein Ves